MNESDSNQQQNQTYYAWIREHFRIDSNDLEEISSCIAVPGLTDVDMPDVLSLLADEDNYGPAAHAGNNQQLQQVPQLAVPGEQQVRRSSLQLAREQRDQQQMQQDALVFSSFQQASTDSLWQPSAPVSSSDQQQLWEQQSALHLLSQQQLSQPTPNIDWFANQGQGACLPAQSKSHAAATDGHVHCCQSSPATDQAAPCSTQHGVQAAGPGSTAGVATPFCLALGELHGLASTAAVVPRLKQEAAAFGVSDTLPAAPAAEARPLHSLQATSSAPPHQSSRPASGNSAGASPHSSESSGGAASAARLATAAVAGGGGAAATDGVVKRRSRKPSQAQREAHRRFRQRRKDMMVSLEAEVAAKQAQLQALALEHTALAAKARALDQLVASAGESFTLVQQLSALQLQSGEAVQQQQHQQGPGVSSVPAAVVAADTSSTQAGPVCVADSCAAVAASSSSNSIAQQQLQHADVSMCHQQQQHLQAPKLDCQATGAAADSDEGALQQLQFGRLEDMQQLLKLGGLAEGKQQLLQLVGRPAQGCLQIQQQHNGICKSSSSASLGRGGGEGSIEQLEAAVTRMLAVPYDPVQLMPANDRERMQGALAILQALIKSLVAEVMQLVLQLGAERGSAAASWPTAHPLQQMQQQQQQGIGLMEQQQQQQCVWEPSAVAPPSSPASVRLQYLLSQVRKEFRKFSVSNRISLYYLQTLNHETGQLGVAPPASHWAKVAQLLKDRLPPEVLADMMVARQLYSSAVARIKEHRHALVLQLQQVLERYSNMRQYRSDLVMSNAQGPHGQGNELLDAIDSSLRKEYTLEGVHQWAFHKLIPHTLAAEMLVHSWPYLPDMHAILQLLQPCQSELQLKQLMPVEQLPPNPGSRG